MRGRLSATQVRHVASSGSTPCTWLATWHPPAPPSPTQPHLWPLVVVPVRHFNLLGVGIELYPLGAQPRGCCVVQLVAGLGHVAGKR